METDSFFSHLLKRLPETLFALIGQPTSQAADYRFDSLEIKKKSYRLDGLFLPTKANLPLYFVEVQFQRNVRFYSNLFAKIFSYLDANDPKQNWVAVAIFTKRALEPEDQGPYRALLASEQVRRIYLDEMTVPASAAAALKILQLVTAAKNDVPELVAELAKLARRETDCEKSKAIVELVEELLVLKFTKISREEVHKMFKLSDIRKSRVWQEAQEEATIAAKREIVLRCVAKGKSLKEIAEFNDMPLAEVRRLAKPGGSKDVQTL
jgi:predicted transposase/invertase (TIGR01784 family)